MDKILSEKVVRRLMFEENLIVKFSKRKSQMKKWLTYITEFRIPAGKIYLSPLVDCYDCVIISWTIETNPDA